MMGSLKNTAICVGLTLGLAACSTMDVAQAPNVGAQDAIAILPMANYTETPEAGARASSIAFGILQTQGHREVLRDHQKAGGDPLLGEINAQPLSEGLDWARKADARYALTGSVQEWRYKVGVDGEPAVGLSFTLIDLDNGATVWSATGSRAGWSRSSLSGVAQDLTRDLLNPLRVRGK